MCYMSMYAACTAVCFYRVQRLAHQLHGRQSVEAADAPISAALDNALQAEPCDGLAAAA